MEVNRCLNCMEEIEDAVCPKCGYNYYKIYEQSPMALKANTVLYGRYLVGKMLGQGGFGMTYIGFDMLLNIKVAIKEYFPMGSVSRDNTVSNLIQWNLSKGQEEQWKEGCENFLKEARKMAKLDSISGIVRVRDTFYENQTAYIIMDFIEGITLKKYLQSNGTMDYVNCINMLSPMMSSLSKVHRQGLIHRDISPDNMMVTGTGNIMLLDLGAAKDISTSREGMSQLVAKKGFSPAEQYMENGSVGPWTDVYAFCATIYYCMYGRLVPEAMERLMEDSLTFPPLPNGSELPEDIKETLADGLAVYTENRIQTMDELLARLAPYITVANQDVISTVQNYSATSKVKRKKKKKKKKLAKVLIPAFSAVFLAVAAVLLLLIRPWEPKVDMLGNSNSNILNDGGMVIKDSEYEYFLDHNYNLYICEFSKEDNVFYVGSSTLLAQNVMYINLGKDKVYFMQDDGTGSIKICDMDFDGSNLRVIKDGLNTSMLMQYALLSNGDEYLYYISMNEDNSMGYVYRYNIKKDKVETVIDEDLCWYNVYGKNIYYTVFNDDNTTSLKKASLNGKHRKILNSDKYYCYGFVENDSIFLYSILDNVMYNLDLNGKEKNALYDAKMNISNFTFAYGEGWIYYVNSDDFDMYRIREDGTANGKIIDDKYAISICYNSNNLWFQEGAFDADGNQKLLRSYLCYKDGSQMFEIDDADLMTSEDGIVYRQDGASLVVCGYVGDEYIVEIPYVIDGIPVTDIDTENLPSGHRYYIAATEEDFEYADSETGDGVILKKYIGEMSMFIVPDTIDGKTVVEIGDYAFAESDVADVVISGSIKKIGAYAFSDCDKLEKVIFEEGVEEIGDYAFAGNPKLTEIELPESLLSIDDACFSETKLTYVYIPKNVATIYNSAFSLTDMENIEVDPDNADFASVDGVLYTKDLTSLVTYPCAKAGSYVIPASVTYIGTGAFFDSNNVTEVSLEAGSKLETVARLAFIDCDSLTKVDLSNAGSSIEGETFYKCKKLSELYFSQGVMSIPENLFYENDIPNSLTKVSYRSDCDCQVVWPNNVTVEMYDVETSE